MKSLKVLKEELEKAESVVLSMALAVAARDSNTGAHCKNIGGLAGEFGKYLHLGAFDITTLKRAGILHDIGKIGMPDSILLKPAPLTKDEWKIMKRHPVIGAKICRPLFTLKKVCPIIRYHHEKWDGSGYPEGLKKRAIPYLVRVFQILDAYDALMRKRPYKKAYTFDQTVKILKEETDRGLWDPELMKKFWKFIRSRRS